MIVKINSFGDPDDPTPVATLEVSGPAELSSVFSPVTIVTEEGKRFHVCQRDSGIEVKCPDGALVAIYLNADGSTNMQEVG